ncbi:DUF4153 domain-containing protein [Aggregatibacter aphrophilus]|jgi:putative membrane protein|uniref:DUF4153 domain-containing protein n=1 Tax=Aggregatibacter kilianii TaxID=2025884 RepID=UPI000DAE385D|nr:DUF4153 domain-containing protein [Aggregatibacter kilianii]RDE99704.1 DUF4153 domain-containing protein [Aggregatibacter aphrophilus]
MKKWLLQFVQLAKQALVRHPVELLLVAICGAIPIFAPEPNAMMERYADFLLWAPMAFMLVNLTHGNKYYRLSIFIPIAFGVLATLVDLNDFTQSARFGILNLAVLVIFLCKNVAKNNRTFMSILLNNMLNAVIATLFALIIGGIGNGLAAAIQALFHVDMYALSMYSRIWLVTWWWIFPLAYLSLSQRENLFSGRFNELSKILLNWILSPALVIYTLIIYAYAVSILIQGKMPEGMIANVAFPYLMIGIVLYTLQILLDNEKWQKFYRLLPWLNLLPLVMLWYATSIRIHHYGFTQDRVYLLMGAMVLALWNFILLVPKIRQYRLLAGVLLLALLSNVFVIDANQIAYQDQLARFDNFVKTQQLLDSNGKLTEEHIKQWTATRGNDAKLSDEFSNRTYAVLLGADEQWVEEFKQHYGIPKEKSLYEWLPESNGYQEELVSYFEIENKQEQFMDIQNYNRFLWLNGEVADRRFTISELNSKEENCQIGLEAVLDSRGKLNGAYVKCVDFLRNNNPPDFLLKIQPKEGGEYVTWNLDAYLRDLFARHNLDIHKKYTKNELVILTKDAKPYVVLGDVVVFFDYLTIEYDERGDYKGYAARRLSITGVFYK